MFTKFSTFYRRVVCYDAFYKHVEVFKTENRNFVRLVNILTLSPSLEEVWQAVREAKYLYIENISKYCIDQMIKDSIVSERLDLIEAKLGLETVAVSEVQENVSDTSLTVAGEIFSHLV